MAPPFGRVACKASSYRYGSAARRKGFFRIDAKFLHCLTDHARLDLALVRQRLQGCQHDKVAVYLEEVTQLFARIAAPETVGAKYAIGAAHIRTNLVGIQLHVIRRGDHRAFGICQALPYPWLLLLILWMQQVPALDLHALAAQLVEAGGTPDVGRHAVIVFQYLRCGLYRTQDGAGTKQLYAQRLLATFAQPVHATTNAFLGTFRHGSMHIVFIHQCDVIENVFLLGIHAPQAVLQYHRQLIGIGRVVADTVRHGAGKDMAVAILMLQAFTIERGTSGGGT